MAVGQRPDGGSYEWLVCPCEKKGTPTGAELVRDQTGGSYEWLVWPCEKKGTPTEAEMLFVRAVAVLSVMLLSWLCPNSNNAP